MVRENKGKFVTVAQIHGYYDLREDKLLDTFHKKGFPSTARPLDPSTKDAFEPSMPEDITKLSYAQLGQLNNLYTQYTGWAAAEAGKADVRLANRESRAHAIYALLRFRKQGSDVDRADQAKIDKSFLEADAEAQKAKYWKVLVDLVVSNANRDMRVISREITRRLAEFETDTRNSAMQSATGLQSIRRAGQRHQTPRSRFRHGTGS